MIPSSDIFSVAGKNVLVTGGSRGIGLMIASGFIRYGANVLLTSRDEKACREAAASLQSSGSSSSSSGGGNVHYVASNVSSREGCKELVKYTSELFQGRLDVLINNAGTSWGESLERESGRANWGWDKVLDLNVKGLFYLSRECIPLLERSKGSCDPGRIINVGSIAGMVPQEAPTHAYDISKAAVHHLTKKMSGDLAKKGITVNALAPGYVPSRMSMGLKAWGADTTKIESSIPLGRMGSEEDMVGASVYFSSRAGAWCTGVILNVDGGTVGAMQVPLSSL